MSTLEELSWQQQSQANYLEDLARQIRDLSQRYDQQQLQARIEPESPMRVGSAPAGAPVYPAGTGDPGSEVILADGSVVGDTIASGAISDVTKFASTIRPVAIVAVLPTLPDSRYPQGACVVLTTDNKLYRSTGTTWTTATAAGDVSGYVSGAVRVVGALPALPDADYPQGTVVFLTTDNQLYRSTGTAWTKAIQAVDVSGYVAGAIQPLGTLPTLPNASYPVGTVVFYTVDGKLYRNVADAWTAVVAAVDVSGYVSGAIHTLGALPTLPSATYPVGTVVFLTTDGKLYRNVADAWTAVVAAADVSGYTSGAIRPLGALPSLPDSSYPVGTVVYLTTDGKLYRNVAGAWTTATSGADITAGTITGDRLTAGTITASQIATGTITATQIAAGTITSSQIATDTITAGNIAAGAVNTSELAANAVTAAKIAAGTITSNEIAADTITAGNIAASAIGTSELAANAVTAAKIAAGTITSNEIAANTITGGNIAAGTITASNIASGTITASNIATDTITAGQIAAGAIGTSELAAGAITLYDSAGRAGLTPYGFAGAWTEFVADGVYNSRYGAGSTGALTTGSTSQVPQWQVLLTNCTGSRDADAAFPGTYKITLTLSRNGNGGLFTNVNNPIPVIGGNYYAIEALFDCTARGAAAASNVWVAVDVQWMTAGGANIGAQTNYYLKYLDTTLSLGWSHSKPFQAPSNAGLAIVAYYIQSADVANATATAHLGAIRFVPAITTGIAIQAVSSSKDQIAITDTTAGAGMTIGGDTNLYRNAANELKTDDALTVAGALSVTGTGTFSDVLTASAGIADAPVLTSTTSLVIGTGSKAFTVNISATGSRIKVGHIVRAYGSTATNFMEGNVTAYSGTTLTVNVTTTGGSGTIASWTIERAQSRMIVYTATGANTWTRPYGLSHIVVELVGGGGQGGGAAATSTGQVATGGGGGGGGYVKKLYTAAMLTSGGVAAAGTCTATVGAGGSGAATGANGNDGADSTWAGGTLTTLTAAKGIGGTAGTAGTTSSGAGGAGGAGSNGDLNIPGGTGFQGRGVSGAIASIGVGGGTALATTASISTAGTGTAGHAYGGGGSGSYLGASTAKAAGGAGADGVVIVTEFYTV